jgi:eukaryotic-like serine/threonine-protein kinase
MPKRVAPRMGDEGSAIGSQIWRIRDVELDERLLELRIGGVVTRIEPKPLGIFMALLRHAQRVVTPREIAALVWPGRVVSEPVIAQAVARLRRSLGPQQDLIRTVHGWGYRLSELPEGSQPDARGGMHDFRAGADHPTRRGWSLVEPHAGFDGCGWLAEHRDSGIRRIVLHLHRAQEISTATREVEEHGALYGSRLEGLFCHALDWNLDATRGPCFVEYPANLTALPDWIGMQGGISQFTTRDRLELVARVCERIAMAHAHRIHFGRLNPSAVLIGAHGLDAPVTYLPGAMQRIRALSPRLYCPEWTGHEALYLAPELRAGGEASASSDSFSLGLMLLQTVAGDWSLLPLPGWERRVTDRGVVALVAAATRLDPAQRPADAAAFAKAVRLCSQTLPRKRRASPSMERETSES